MQYLIQSTIAIIAIMDPLGAAPIFLGLTDDMTRWQRTRAAVRASFYCIVILTVSAFGGEWILRAFGVTLPAFQVAGGLIIVLMGLEMLSGTPTRVQHDPKEPGEDDTILVPFAMPLIAGPGAITTVITLTAQHPNVSGRLTILLAVVLATIVLLVTLLSANWLKERISYHVQKVFLRFMGLILLAIGAQLLLTGVQRFLN